MSISPALQAALGVPYSYKQLYRAIRMAKGWQWSDLPDRECTPAEQCAFAAWVLRTDTQWESLPLRYRREVRARFTSWSRRPQRSVP